MGSLGPALSRTHALSPQFLCTVVAIVLHYVYMSTFAWTFVEGLHVYRVLTEARNIDAGPMRFYYVVGWGVPAIITGEDPGSGPAGGSAWHRRHRSPCRVIPRPPGPLSSVPWPPAEAALPALASAHTGVITQHPPRGCFSRQVWAS